MAKLVTVYKTHMEHVSHVVEYLEGRNLTPVVLDQVELPPFYRGGESQIRITVPEAQRDMALSVLAEMERKEQARSAPNLKASNGAIWLVIIGGVFLAAILAVDPSGKWFYGISGILVAVASVFVLRWGWRKDAKNR